MTNFIAHKNTASNTLRHLDHLRGSHCLFAFLHSGREQSKSLTQVDSKRCYTELKKERYSLSLLSKN